MFKIYARQAPDEPCSRIGRAYKAIQAARAALGRVQTDVHEAEIRLTLPTGAERLQEVYYRKEDQLQCLSIETLQQGVPNA